jgi:hypothetical protein
MTKNMEIHMKIKSTIVGLIAASTMLVVAPGFAWNHMNCSGKGWHLVSKNCPIQRADNWQDYASGGYLQPMTDMSMFMMMK